MAAEPPLDVDQTIALLCARHGVSPAFGERLRTLLERAAASPPERRRLLLRVVVRSFEEEAQRAAAANLEPADLRLVVSVARILHDWSPGTDVDDLPRLPGVSTDAPDGEDDDGEE